MIGYEEALQMLSRECNVYENATGYWEMSYTYHVWSSLGRFMPNASNQLDHEAFLRLVKRLEIQRTSEQSNWWRITDKGRARVRALQGASS